MDNNADLVNRVAQSGLITINLEDFFPKEQVSPFDLKDYLFMGMILKEKDFREAMAAHDWTQYDGKILAIYCSADAIIPMWAYMLIAVGAGPFANQIIYGDTEMAIQMHYADALSRLDVEAYRDKRIVIKGCGDAAVPPYAYAEVTRLLLNVAASIMYGEPCSTVPIFKKKRVVG